MFKHFKTAKNQGFKTIEITDQITTEPTIKIEVVNETQFQTIIGFGGAFTEASAYTLSQMTPDKREQVLQAYFNKEAGLGYQIGRVAIHSCDFALGNYTYVEDNDTTLASFDISRDFKWVIPMIKDAERIAGHKIQLLASPWSPPAWMKDTKEMNHGGKLLPEYYQTWANYYVKFLDAYKEAGIEVFAITVQNEPAATQIWDSCVYTAEEERDFVRDYLGPTVHATYPDVHIIVWDHNRDIIVERGDTVLKDEEARKHVWGTGLHWYVSEEFQNLTTLHNLHPDKHILFTEGCIEGGVHLHAWHTGERYARNMIGDFRNYCEGYIDWNLTLNEIGGPNHVGNYCDAPIISNTKTNELTFESSYYYIGHFSKYIQPGAKRTESLSPSSEVSHVSFLNPDGTEVVIVLNESDDTHIVEVAFDQESYTFNCDPHSISTILK